MNTIKQNYTVLNQVLSSVSERGKPKPCILLPSAAGGHLDGLKREKGKGSLAAIHTEPHFLLHTALEKGPSAVPAVGLLQPTCRTSTDRREMLK